MMSDPITRLAALSALALGLVAASFAPIPALAQAAPAAEAPAAEAPAAEAPAAAAPAPLTPLVLSYAAFEASIPHADLADCPEALAGADRFCRMTLNAETITVWVFGLEGDQPLIAAQTYDIEELSIGF